MAEMFSNLKSLFNKILMSALFYGDMFSPVLMIRALSVVIQIARLSVILGLEISDL